MANEYGAITYDDASRRENLTDIIKIIDPTDTPFFSGLDQTGEVRGTLVEWQEDILDARGSNAFVEGHSATYTIANDPGRIVNQTQIIRTDGNVSKTLDAVDHAGFGTRMAWEQMKRTKEFKNDVEWSCILQSGNTGDSGTARQMKGALALIQTVVSALSSAVLSETIYNDFMQLVDAEGGKVDEIYVGSWLKRKISAFTANSTKNIDAEDKRLVNRIDVYDGDFGRQKIFKTRELSSTGASTAKLMGIQSDLWKFGWLRKPKMSVVPPDGSDRSSFWIVGEGTLIGIADGGNCVIQGLHNKQ